MRLRLFCNYVYSDDDLCYYKFKQNKKKTHTNKNMSKILTQISYG